MNTRTSKIQTTGKHVVFNLNSNKTSEKKSVFKIDDNRKETVTQQKLQNMANSGGQVQNAVQLHSMANNHLTGTIQKKDTEEEELLQGKFNTIQKQGPEEEELLQGKFNSVQRKEIEEEEPLQGKFQSIQKKENNTGLPDNLKSGIENLSGVGMDDVKVHYNSEKPSTLQAHAYAQGTNIHLASGQEKHLPHEAWHVVQQKQGRVKPTMQLKNNVSVNDDKGLEKEADVMGEKAIQMKSKDLLIQRMPWPQITPVNQSKIPGIIEDSVQYGGHAGEKHIYIGWAGLMAREISDASAFGDEVQAYKIIAEIIKENEHVVENHIESNPNKNGNFTFTKSFQDLKVLSYSQVVSSAKGEPEGSIGGKVIVVLRYRRIANVGQVFLTTAYPIALDTSEFISKKKNKHDFERHRQKSRNYGKDAQKSYNQYLDSV